MDITEKIDKFLAERKWSQGPGERRPFRKQKWDHSTPFDPEAQINKCPECGSDDITRVYDSKNRKFTKCQQCYWSNKVKEK